MRHFWGTRPLLLLLWLSVFLSSSAEELKLLPSEEDWTGSTRRLKDMPLDKNGDWRLSLGGSARLQYESLSNVFEPFESDGYLLYRFTLHGDLRHRQSRLFVDLQSATASWLNEPSFLDSDDLFFHQLFVEQKIDNVALRIGRQELNYGIGRLVSVREGPNIRRSFDAIKVQLAASDDWDIDFLWGRPVQQSFELFDNAPLTEDRTLAGIYSHGPGQEYYFLGYSDPSAKFQDVVGREDRYTLGAHWFGEEKSFDYDFELFYQFGNFDGQRIHAWSAASVIGYTFEEFPGQPRVGLSANIVSGDHSPFDNELNTFNALFPRGSYFGEIALLGPANLMDLHPGVSFELTPTLTLESRVDFFWRQSLSDGIYTPSGTEILSAGSSRARYIGAQPDIMLIYEPSEHWRVSLDHSVFFPGAFVKAMGETETIQFTQASLKYRF